MHTLPMLAFFIALWLALGTDLLLAQSNPTCDTRSRPNAMGTLDGNRYTAADSDTAWSIADRFCLTTTKHNWDEFVRVNNIDVVSPDIDGGLILQIPGLAPSTRAGCTAPRLSIDTPRHGGSVGPTFRITGSGCGLSSNEVKIYMLDDNNVWQVKATVGLTGGRWGEGTFETQLTVSKPRGSVVWLAALAGVQPSNPISVTVSSPPPACAAARLEIISPQPSRPVPPTIEIAGIAGANCTVRVEVTHSRRGYLGEKIIFTGADSTWRTRWPLPAGNVPGDTVIIDSAIAQSSLRDSVEVPVDAGTVSGGVRRLDGSGCQLSPKSPPVPTFAYPGGPRVDTLSFSTNIVPRMVVYHDGAYWFAISRDPRNPDEWVRRDTMVVGNGCYP